MNRPRLPQHVEERFDALVLKTIYSYVPKYPKVSPPPKGLQRQLEKLQISPKQTAMWLYGLEDFMLE